MATKPAKKPAARAPTKFAKAAKQDDFVRITLRLPPDLHEVLVKSAGASSLNAEIVSRIEQSFSSQSLEHRLERFEDNENRLMFLVADLRKSQLTLENQAQQLADLATRYAAERDGEAERRRELEDQLKLLLDVLRFNSQQDPGT